MSKYQSPMGLPDEHMRLVGIISAHWEWIELLLERAIAEIMDHTFARVALLNQLISFNDKCDLVLMYARVFEEPSPEMWKQFTLAIKALKDAYSKRNEYVHAQWKRDKTTSGWGKAVVRTKGGRLTITDLPVDAKDLERAAQQIWDAGNNFTILCQMHGVLMPPSPDKPGEPHPTPDPSLQK